jgi:hypothetical protein
MGAGPRSSRSRPSIGATRDFCVQQRIGTRGIVLLVHGILPRVVFEVHSTWSRLLCQVRRLLLQRRTICLTHFDLHGPSGENDFAVGDTSERVKASFDNVGGFQDCACLFLP